MFVRDNPALTEFHTFILLSVLCLTISAQQPADSAYEQAVSLLQSADLVQAEQVLRASLRDHANDAPTLMLLGVVLDEQKRYDEAEHFYKHALQLRPREAVLLNNLGNHYLAAGKPEDARAIFLKVVALEPRHLNANLQLAQLAASGKKGQEVLRYIDRLPAREHENSTVVILRARALYWTGEQARADTLLKQVESQSSGDPRTDFSVGMAYVEGKRYQLAEAAFSRVLQTTPTNFNVLYNLGLAATNAGHLERAHNVLETALKQHPDDVDALYTLARAYAQSGQYEMALVLLARAQKLTPNRPEVLEFEARASDTLGYYGEAVRAYGDYLKLRPNDDIARRDRAFDLARINQFTEAIRELESYLQKHPKDSVGYLYLAMAEALDDPDRALEHINRSLDINPSYVNSLYVRGSLMYQRARCVDAVRDFEAILEQEPTNAPTLDRLGQCYLQLDRTQEAMGVLQRAFELAPEDSKVLMHYSQALRNVGREEEARNVLSRFRRQARAHRQQVPRSGVIEFLNLTPELQHARYLENLKKAVETNPSDATVGARWGMELLVESRTDEALAVFRDVLGLEPDLKTLADSGRALLTHKQYSLAKEFLQRAAMAPEASAYARLDLAIAIFHAVSPEAGLEELDRSSPTDRNGDYYLVRAQMLDALGKVQDAIDSLNRGLRAEPTRPDLYLQSSLFLFNNKRYHETLELLQQANRAIPDNPELLLAQAIALETLSRNEECLKLLDRIQLRWPEWDRPYLIRGIILQDHGKNAEAKQMVETAMTLGNNSAHAYYYLALTTTITAPDDTASAEAAIARALKLDPDGPYIRVLAGKIAYWRDDYVTAVEHLSAAVRTFPNMLEAHYTLARAYQSLGEQEKARAEFEEVRRIRREIAVPEYETPPVGKMLFSIEPR